MTKRGNRYRSAIVFSGDFSRYVLVYLAKTSDNPRGLEKFLSDSRTCSPVDIAVVAR